MKQPVIILDKITKEYYLERPRTLKKWLKTLFSPFDKFTVIKNFSLTVNAGELILLTGPNGSGKTTLLKLITGITVPDHGSVKTLGRIVPLIELGAGFNYDLTGKENIVTNATILGIEKFKIIKIIPDIVRYSGLKDFIDVPLKRYSSGMISRLAFSIAAFAEPDILLIDEVFAVGDETFRKKSTSYLRKSRKQGKTIILTSHFSKLLEVVPDRVINLHSHL